MAFRKVPSLLQRVVGSAVTNEEKIKLKFARSMWGVLDFTKAEDTQPSRWKAVAKQLRSADYSAIEFPMGPFDPFVSDHAIAQQILRDNELRAIPQLHTCSYPVGLRKVEDHIEDFKRLADQAFLWDPVLINSHSGCDSWNIDQSLEFLSSCLEIEEQIGIPIVHETHRQRILYNPWTTRDILKQLPDLKINADLSHFCVVAERVFDDGSLDSEWPEILDLIADRCRLIHARVGHAEGPQVSDPSSEEFSVEVQQHMKWWRKIWEKQKELGESELYIEPEHGPPPYLATLPHTRMPVADLWKVNDYVADLVRKELECDEDTD